MCSGEWEREPELKTRLTSWQFNQAASLRRWSGEFSHQCVAFGRWGRARGPGGRQDWEVGTSTKAIVIEVASVLPRTNSDCCSRGKQVKLLSPLFHGSVWAARFIVTAMSQPVIATLADPFYTASCATWLPSYPTFSSIKRKSNHPHYLWEVQKTK